MWWIFGLSLILFYFYITKPLSYWKNLGVPHKKPWPVFGNISSALLRKTPLFNIVRDTYNLFPGTRYYGFYQFSVPGLVIRDIDLIKQITIKDFEHFTDHTEFISENAEPLLQRNIFCLKGSRWHDMRTILTPSFTSKRMKMMFVFLSQCAEKLTSNIQEQINETITVDFKDISARFTNDAAASVAFGVEIDSFKNRQNEFYLMAKAGTSFSGLKFLIFQFVPNIMKFLDIPFFSKSITTFFTNVITEEVERRERGFSRPDMIQAILDSSKKNQNNSSAKVCRTADELQEKGIKKSEKFKLSVDDVTAQGVMFFFAGFDTTATAMSFAAYELALNYEIQQKLHVEIDETLVKCNGKITYESLSDMKYLEMIVNEVLRKWPSGFQLDRVCVKDYIISPKLPNEKPLLIKKGQLIIIPVVGIHYDPTFFPEPNKFHPERFDNKNNLECERSAFLPFGIGPRSCIASRFAMLEVKVFLFYLFANFEVVPVKETQVPLILVQEGFNIKPSKGFWLGLKERKT